MSEFTYNLPNPQDVLERLRVTLKNKGDKQARVATLLEGASLTFHDSEDFGDRWNSYWVDVQFNVRAEVLAKIEQHQAELTDLVKKMIPADTGYDVRDVDFFAGSTNQTIDLGQKAEKLRRGLAEKGYWASDKERVARIATAEADLVNQGSPDRYPEYTDYEFRLKVDSKTFAEWSHDESKLRAVESRIQEELRPLFDVEMPSLSVLNTVTVGPRVQEVEEGWEEEALRYATGEGVNNQGRAHSENVASLEDDFLRFRSEPEIHLYRGLKVLELPLAPLPVFVRGGDDSRRIEPDFFVLYKGMPVVIELDGDTWHDESPVEAHERLDFLTDEGVKEFRVKASECDSRQKGIAQAKRLRKKMKRAYESR